MRRVAFILIATLVASTPEYIAYVGKDKADESKVLGHVFVIPSQFKDKTHADQKAGGW